MQQKNVQKNPDAFFETLVRDERIISKKERILLANIIQHATANSSSTELDKLILSRITSAVENAVTQQVLGSISKVIMDDILATAQNSGSELSNLEQNSFAPLEPVPPITPPHMIPVPPITPPHMIPVPPIQPPPHWPWPSEPGTPPTTPPPSEPSSPPTTPSPSDRDSSPITSKKSTPVEFGAKPKTNAKKASVSSVIKPGATTGMVDFDQQEV